MGSILQISRSDLALAINIILIKFKAKIVGTRSTYSCTMKRIIN